MNRSFLAKTVIRIIAIMLLPIAINIDFGMPSYIIYTSLVLTFGSYPYFEDYMPYPYTFPVSFNLIIVGLAIAVCIPGIYFTRWLSEQPREKAIRKMALAAAVFTSLIVYPLSILIPYGGPYIPMPPIYGGSTIHSVVPWVIAIFVVLPVMGRHGSFIDSDRKAAYFSQTPEHLIHEGGIRPGRYTILSYILGIISLCIPSNAFAIGYYSPWEPSTSYGLITPIWIGTYYSGSGFANFSFYIPPSFTVFFTFLLGIFSIIFAYSVLQYLQTDIQRMRVLAYGALSIIAPYAFVLITSAYMVMIPVPVLLILGLSMIFMLKQIPPRQTIWEDKKVRMWYEKDQEITVMGDQPSVRQAKQSSPTATVKVPFTYLIASKLRGLRSPNVKPNPETKSLPKTNPHKADWAESEDLWGSGEGE